MTCACPRLRHILWATRLWTGGLGSGGVRPQLDPPDPPAPPPAGSLPRFPVFHVWPAQHTRSLPRRWRTAIRTCTHTHVVCG